MTWPSHRSGGYDTTRLTSEDNTERLIGGRMEQVAGIGPASLGWEPSTLPLSYTCIGSGESVRLPGWSRVSPTPSAQDEVDTVGPERVTGIEPAMDFSVSLENWCLTIRLHPQGRDSTFSRSPCGTTQACSSGQRVSACQRRHLTSLSVPQEGDDSGSTW